MITRWLGARCFLSCSFIAGLLTSSQSIFLRGDSRGDYNQPTTRSSQQLLKTLKQVQHCAKTPYTCKYERGRVLKHDLNLDEMETQHMERLLDGLRIRFLGDSGIGQLASAMECTLKTNTKVDWQAMFVVPSDPDVLRQMLKEAIKDADVLVLSVGLHYNPNPSNRRERDGDFDMDVDASWSEALVKFLCDQGPSRPAFAGRKSTDWMKRSALCWSTGTQIKSWEAKPFPTKLHGNLQYTFARRDSGTLTMREYASDLARLRSALLELARTENHFPQLIWKYNQPQHFPHTDSGMYDVNHPTLHGEGRKTKKVSKHLKCSAIKNLTANAGRDKLAERMLRPPLGTSSMLYMNRSRSETVPHYDLHLNGGDCTHYCLNSMVPRLWIRDLLEILGSSSAGTELSLKGVNVSPRADTSPDFVVESPSAKLALASKLFSEMVESDPDLNPTDATPT